MSVLSSFNTLLLFLGDLKASLLLRAGLWLTVANLAGGLLGYAFQLLMGRMLAPAEFALFSAVMALTMFFASPLTAIFMFVSRRVSRLRVDCEVDALSTLYITSHKYLAIAGIVSFFLLVPFAGFAQRYLKSTDALPVWILCGTLVFGAFFSINNAYFQGLQHFGRLGGLSVLSAITKILASMALVQLGFGVNGALGGVLFATILVWAVGFGFLAPTFHSHAYKRSLALEPFPLKAYAPVFFANVAFAAMTQLDMVVVNWYFSQDEAGLYAAASVLGKAVLYLPSGLALALFPMVAENHARQRDSARILLQTIGITAFLSTTAAVAYWFLGDLLINYFYGSAYAGAGNLLRWYGLAILPISLVMVAEYFLIAKGRVLFAWLFIGIAPAQLTAYALWNKEMWMILLIMGACGTLLAFIGYAMLWRDFKDIQTR